MKGALSLIVPLKASSRRTGFFSTGKWECWGRVFIPLAKPLLSLDTVPNMLGYGRTVHGTCLFSIVNWISLTDLFLFKQMGTFLLFEGC